MGEEGLGKEGEVYKVMTVITNPDSRVEIQADGQTEGRDGQTVGSSGGLCPNLPVNTAAITAAGHEDVSQTATSISEESLHGEDVKENRDSTVEAESQQDKSKSKSLTESFS